MKIGYASTNTGVNDPEWEITIHCDRDLAERVLNLYKAEIKHLVDCGEFDGMVKLCGEYNDLKEVLDGNNE